MQLSIAEISKTQFYEPRFNNYLNLHIKISFYVLFFFKGVI
jgi:hypothetical protein